MAGAPPPAIPAAVPSPPVDEPMEEPLETVYVDTIPVLSDDEMARSSDVTPWVNDLGRPFEDYRFASHLDVVEDR